MSNVRMLFVLLAPLALAACQSGADTRAMNEDLLRGQACSARLEADPDNAGLAIHMPPGGAPATAWQREDRARPRAAERAALRRWKIGLDRCRDITVAAVGRFAPDSMLGLRKIYARSDEVIEALARGRLTWGTANRRRDALAQTAWRRIWPETSDAGTETSVPLAPRPAASGAPISLATRGP